MWSYGRKKVPRENADLKMDVAIMGIRLLRTMTIHAMVIIGGGVHTSTNYFSSLNTHRCFIVLPRYNIECNMRLQASHVKAGGLFVFIWRSLSYSNTDTDVMSTSLASIHPPMVPCLGGKGCGEFSPVSGFGCNLQAWCCAWQWTPTTSSVLAGEVSIQVLRYVTWLDPKPNCRPSCNTAPSLIKDHW